MDETTALRRAREAILRDDSETAQRLLAQLLHEQPGSETAWTMLSTVVDQPDRKRDCLERVLHINPGNEAARAQLAALDALREAALPSPEAPPVETAQEEPAGPSLEAELEPAASQGERPSTPPEDGPSPSLATEPAPEYAAADAEQETVVEAPHLPPEPAANALAEPMGERAPQAQDEKALPSAPAPDAAADVEQQTVVEAPHLPPEPAADALAEPLGEPVPELHGEPSSPPTAATPEAVDVQRRSLLEALAPDEVVLHWTRLSPGVFLRPLAAVLGVGILFLLPAGELDRSLVLAVDGVLLVLALAYLGLRAIRYFGSEYVVTDRRVLARRGFLARLTVDIPIGEIEEVTVSRGFFGRSPSSGNVWIRRTDRTRVMFWRIRQPEAFREAIEHGLKGAAAAL